MEENVESILRRWNDKILECGVEHRDPSDLPYIVSSSSNPLMDKPKGYCSHCNSFYNRPFREEELKSIHSLDKVYWSRRPWYCQQKKII